MELVEALVELQINCHVYNGLYALDRVKVSEKIHSTFQYFHGLNLSAKTMSTIIDGVVQHPVNLRMKDPRYTEHSDIQRYMLTLRESIYHLNKKHKGSLTKRKVKKILQRRTIVDSIRTSEAEGELKDFLTS